MTPEDQSSIEDSVYGKGSRPRTGGHRASNTAPEVEPSEEPDEIQDEVAESDVEDEKASDQPLKEFPKEHREAFRGLIYLGRLEDTFDWAGHNFTVRTLTSLEHIISGMLIKPYLGTRVESRAWQASIVAAGTVHVDGEPLYVPLGAREEPSEVLRKKFQYVIENWHPSTVDALHRRIAALEIEAREVLAAMGKASG